LKKNRAEMPNEQGNQTMNTNTIKTSATKGFSLNHNQSTLRTSAVRGIKLNHNESAIKTNTVKTATTKGPGLVLQHNESMIKA
jgi:hypothetical protein